MMSKRKNYVRTGKCIWCGKELPDVTFDNEPHIVPESLGGSEIGIDVCDACNQAFGTASKGVPNTNLVFKEIFNATRFVRTDLNPISWKHFHSVFFRYEHSRSRFVIRNNFKEGVITRQFKRSLYEVFLQKYHKVTGDGNNPKFTAVREFARYGKGELKVFYAFNNVVLIPDMEGEPILPMNQNLIDEMHKTGMFCFWFLGHPLYLEVFPILFNANGYNYLKKEAGKMLIPAKGDESIFELTNIMQMDFFMTRFNR